MLLKIQLAYAIITIDSIDIEFFCWKPKNIPWQMNYKSVLIDWQYAFPYPSSLFIFFYGAIHDCESRVVAQNLGR